MAYRKKSLTTIKLEKIHIMNKYYIRYSIYNIKLFIIIQITFLFFVKLERNV